MQRSIQRRFRFGLIERVRSYLRKIPTSDLNISAIGKLLGYLERNSSDQTCYALLRLLGLPNSNKEVKRTNNLVTSKRQKHTLRARESEAMASSLW